MAQHYYVPLPDDGRQDVTLPEGLAHHLTRVLRARAGDTLDGFDGSGSRFRFTLSSVKKSSVTATVSGIEADSANAAPAAELALAVIKGQAMDRALASATESGASHLSLLMSDRSNVRLSPDRLENKLAHWRRVVIGACEQSGRSRIPELTLHGSCAEWITGAPDDRLLLLLDQGGPAPQPDEATQAHVALIGPEGGWSDDERRLFAERGLRSVSLGTTTLRAETVPAAWLSLVNYLRGR